MGNDLNEAINQINGFGFIARYYRTRYDWLILTHSYENVIFVVREKTRKNDFHCHNIELIRFQFFGHQIVFNESDSARFENEMMNCSN